MSTTFAGIQNENEFYSHHYIAVELAEVSLWLNCIHKDGHEPWFGFQLVCGNSLVGARRQVYDSAKLGEKVRRGDRWFNFGPERVTAARTGTVYHFLLPDPGMADYCNKAAMRYEPANFARIKAWRKAFCRPFTAEEIAELEALSTRVDELWALHTEQLARDRRETEDTLPVWGSEGSTRPRRTPNASSGTTEASRNDASNRSRCASQRVLTPLGKRGPASSSTVPCCPARAASSLRVPGASRPPCDWLGAPPEASSALRQSPHAAPSAPPPVPGHTDTGRA